MQWVSLIYLKSLVAENAFQPEGIKPDTYSHSMAILIIFLSNKEHQGIEHMHIGLVVRCEGCHLYMQDGILPFVKPIEADLKKVRDGHAQNKDPGGEHSHSLLIANYRGIMAVPTDPPYSLVYPTVYNNNMEDQNHFNTAASPSGLCTHSCICHALLQHMDMDLVCQRTYKGGCLIIPHGAQYRTLFLEIIVPHNHWGPLIDHNIGEPYPMAAMGDFCLVDPIFPGSPGDSLLFKEDDLTRKRKGFCIPTYREEKPQPTVPKEDKHKSPQTMENMPSSSHKAEEPGKTSSRNSGASSSQAPDSTSSKKPSHQGKRSPSAKEWLDSHDTEEHHASSSKHKDRSHSEKSSKCSSDKEGSSTPHKCALSSPPCTGSEECPWKEPHVHEPSCIPSESSHTNYRSLSRSMSELEDHGCFATPTSSSTPNKSGSQQHYRSSSTDSRLSTMPLDMGLHSFSYSDPTGFCRGEATPVTSVAGSYHVSSSAWQTPGLTSLPATQTLNVEQSTEVFNLAAECQVLGTDLAKQFQKLSRLEAMHHTVVQATAHKTINLGWMAWNMA